MRPESIYQNEQDNNLKIKEVVMLTLFLSVKKAIGVIILSCVSLYGYWHYVHPQPTEVYLRDIAFTSQYLFICGGGSDGIYGMVLRSSDGGTNWNFVYEDWGGRFESITFVSDSIGYVVGYNGRIMKTFDAGDNWVELNSGESRILSSVSFPTRDTGFVCGSFSLILKTTDGGENWFSLSDSGTSYYQDIDFVSADTGYVCGMNPGIILKTTTGGINWDTLNSGTSSNIFALYFLNSLNGYAIGIDVILKTTDGGGVWTTYSFSPGTITGYDIYFASNEIGYAVGYANRKILRTTDAGHTWDIINLPITFLNHWFYGVKFKDNFNGYVVGNYGGMIKTTDGGNTWLYLEKVITFEDIYRIDFPENATTGYAIGTVLRDRGVLKTTNGGEDWVFLPLPSGSGQQFFWAMDFIDNNIGYVGGQGEIYRTNDGGASWQDVSYPISIFGLTFLDSEVGFVAGYDLTVRGIILKTQSGGSNWVPKAFGFPCLRDIQFVTHDRLLAVGDTGTILKTEDGGETWSILSGGAVQNLRAIHFPNNTIGYIAGATGTILKTSDGGNNWQLVNTNTTEGFVDIHFINSEIGYGVTYQGNILKTEDGGENWIIDSFPKGVSVLNAIYFPHPDTGYVAGNLGAIMKKEGWWTNIAEEKAQKPKVESKKLEVYPNPFTTKLDIRYEIPDTRYELTNGPISDISYLTSHSIKIYDATGRLIRQWDYQTIRLSDQIVWSGDDDSGRKVPAGVYFVRLESEGFKQVEKVILLR